MSSQQSPKAILGTAQLSSPYGVTNLTGVEKSPDVAHSYLHEAKRLGISILDTAPAYGAAESLIGSSNLQFEIHTKLEKNSNPITSLKASLSRMKIDKIDILYIHDIDAFKLYPKKTSDDLTGLLGDHVKNVGVSLYDITDLELVLKFPAVTHVQVPMNLLDQKFDGDVLKRIRSYGLSCIVRSVFLQGALLTDPEKLPERIKHLYPFLKSVRHELNLRGISPLEGCLALVCSNAALDGIILGAQSEDELRLIMRAWERVRTFPPDLEWLSEIHSPTPSAVDPRLW